MSAGSELASARAGTADVGEIIRRVVAEEAASDSVRIGWGRDRAVSSMAQKIPQVPDREPPPPLGGGPPGSPGLVPFGEVRPQ